MAWEDESMTVQEIEELFGMGIVEIRELCEERGISIFNDRELEKLALEIE